jgi:hypothetical protein
LGIVLGSDTLTLRGDNLIAPGIDLNRPSARANSFLLSPVGVDDIHTLGSTYSTRRAGPLIY